MLRADINKPTQTKLDLIDDIQRLGVSYHFESEIDEILQKMHEANQDCDLGDDENVQELYYISLQFRLLRQSGYKISAGKSFFSPITLVQYLVLLKNIKKKQNLAKCFHLHPLSNFWELKLQLLCICVMSLNFTCLYRYFSSGWYL